MDLSPPTTTPTSSDSPEFEFNPCFPSPTSLHSADQLFFRGLLLPLHLLPVTNSTPQIPSEINNPISETEPLPDPQSPATDPSPATPSSSKRWTHVFKKPTKKPPDEEPKINNTHKEKNKDTQKQRSEKDKKKESRKAAGGANSAELNINIWPFSRSRSAGNNSGGRTRSSSSATRKVSSAPCSRSNSAGESKSRRNWPTSPARSGVHLGRTSPVWQLPRTSSGKAPPEVGRRSKAVKVDGANKGRVLSLTVPMCIGYRHRLSCRSDEASAVNAVDADEAGAGVGGSNGNLFGLRGLFSKKVY